MTIRPLAGRQRLGITQTKLPFGNSESGVFKALSLRERLGRGRWPEQQVKHLGARNFTSSKLLVDLRLLPHQPLPCGSWREIPRRNGSSEVTLFNAIGVPAPSKRLRAASL